MGGAGRGQGVARAGVCGLLLAEEDGGGGVRGETLSNPKRGLLAAWEGWASIVRLDAAWVPSGEVVDDGDRGTAGEGVEDGALA